MGRRTTVARRVVSAVVALMATFLVITTPGTARASTTSGTTTVAMADVSDAYCEVTFVVLVEWSTGYGAGLSVRNISDVPVRWELVQVRLPDPVLTLQTWNATATLSGSNLTLISAPNSGVLAPGETRLVAIVYASGRFVAPTSGQVVCTPV